MAQEFWLRDYGPAIAWFVAALGWFVSSRQANQRERRKELRSDIADISTQLDSTLALIKEALLDADTTPHKVRYLNITTTLANVDQRLERLLNRRFRPRCEVFKIRCREASEDFFDLASGDSVLAPPANEADCHQTLLETHHLARTLVHDLHSLFVCEFEQ